MRIALATQGLHPSVGGPAFSVTAVGTRLQSLGDTVAYWAADAARFKPDGRQGTPLWPWEVELVHAFGAWRPFMHAVCASALVSRRPLVFSPIGMFEPWAMEQKRWKKRLALSLYQRRDVARARAVHVTAISELESVRRLGFENPVALIPHGVDAPTAIVPRSADKPRRRAVFMSRLEPKKGIAELLRAWSVLRPRDWDLVVAGPDHRGYRRVVAKTIADLGLAQQVELRDAVWGQQKYELLCSADLFLLPTYSENFGLAVPEALAHGAPALTTRGAPWAELLETGSGWWIDVGYEPLLQALEEVLATPSETLHAMGLRGRQFVLERYGWQSVALRHHRLYRYLVGQGPRPDYLFDA
jgi:glycosyltransferase involved in cell wall biosynthesis